VLVDEQYFRPYLIGRLRLAVTRSIHLARVHFSESISRYKDVLAPILMHLLDD